VLAQEAKDPEHFVKSLGRQWVLNHMPPHYFGFENFDIEYFEHEAL
jgi:hypothetical protein